MISIAISRVLRPPAAHVRCRCPPLATATKRFATATSDTISECSVQRPSRTCTKERFFPVTSSISRAKLRRPAGIARAGEADPLAPACTSRRPTPSGRRPTPPTPRSSDTCQAPHAAKRYDGAADVQQASRAPTATGSSSALPHLGESNLHTREFEPCAGPARKRGVKTLATLRRLAARRVVHRPRSRHLRESIRTTTRDSVGAVQSGRLGVHGRSARRPSTTGTTGRCEGPQAHQYDIVKMWTSKGEALGPRSRSSAACGTRLRGHAHEDPHGPRRGAARKEWSSSTRSRLAARRLPGSPSRSPRRPAPRTSPRQKARKR